MVERKLQSSTVKTYIAAIRSVLNELGEKIKEDQCLLTSLTKACRLKNNEAVHRFPICKGMLKMLLKQVTKMFTGSQTNQQPYLETLFKAIYSTAYYGLLRIGEMAKGSHTILVRNTYIGTNKDKILFILMSSKTHCKGDPPQKVKISRSPLDGKSKQIDKFCPFQLLRDYMAVRPESRSKDKQFFVLSDNTPVCPAFIYKNLKLILKEAGFDDYYSFHSFIAGRTQDLLRLGLSVETIKDIGCWKSNAVFAYLKN